MSMFNWQGDSGSILSSYLWLYFAITIPLTLIVLLIWYLWFKLSDKEYQKRKELDVKLV